MRRGWWSEVKTCKANNGRQHAWPKRGKITACDVTDRVGNAHGARKEKHSSADSASRHPNNNIVTARLLCQVTGIITSNAPVPVILGRPSTIFPDGVERSS